MDLNEARQRYPQLSNLDDNSAVDVLHTALYKDWDRNKLAEAFGVAPAAPPADPNAPGDFNRGFQKSMLQIPQTVGGAAALAGDLVGSEGLKNYGLDIYKKRGAQIEALTKPSDSFTTSVLEGEGDVADFVQHGAGYVIGQAGAALATGGVGGFIGSQLAKQGVKKVVQREVAERAAARTAAVEAAPAAQQALMRPALDAANATLERRAMGQIVGQAGATGAKVGTAVGLGGANFVQSAGGIYGEAVDEAAEEGRELDGWDKARVVGSAIAAAGVETLTDTKMLSAIRGGGRRTITNEAGEQVQESLARSIPREVGKGMVREGSTEAVQTEIERYGAGKDLTGADALRDVVDSSALGALGGGMGGAVTGLHGRAPAQPAVPQLDNTGPISQAANVVLALENKPASMYAFPDGSQGDEAAVNEYLKTIPDPQRREQRRREMLGLDLETGAQIPTDQKSQELIRMASEKRAPMPIELAEDYLKAAQQQNKAQGAKHDFAIVPHASGTGFIVVPHNWLSVNEQAKAIGAAREYREQIKTGNNPPKPTADQQAEQTKKELEEQGYFGLTLNINGQPFRAKVAAMLKARQMGEGHEVLEIPGGFGVLPPAPAQAETPAAETAPPADALQYGAETGEQPETDRNVTGEQPEGAGPIASAAAAEIEAAANEAATSELNDLPEPTQAQKDAGNYKVGRAKLHGMDISIENPAGSKRKGVDADGRPWENELKHHYGYIRKTEGADGDHVDAFIGANPDIETAFVVDQYDPKTGKFDEHKVMLGFDDEAAALDGYEANYEPGWKGAGSIHAMPVAQFKEWLKGDTTKPVSGIDDIGPQVDESPAQVDESPAQVDAEGGNSTTETPANGYEDRNKARMEAMKQAKDDAEIADIVAQEHADGERHFDGTSTVERAGRLRKFALKEEAEAAKEQSRYEAGEWVKIPETNSGSRSSADQDTARLSREDDTHEYRVQSWNDQYWVSKRKKPATAEATPAEAKPKKLPMASKEDLDHLFGTLQKKQIPDMTDAELLKARELYAPDHKRRAKIDKAIEARGLDKPADQPAAEPAPTKEKPARLKERDAKIAAKKEQQQPQPEEKPAAIEQQVQDFIDGKTDTPPELPANPDKVEIAAGMGGTPGHEFDMVSNRVTAKVQGAFASMEVQATAIGEVDSFINFGTNTQHGRYYVTSLDAIFALDGKGNWKLNGTDKSGTYNPADLSNETIRVLKELGAKVKEEAKPKAAPVSRAPVKVTSLESFQQFLGEGRTVETPNGTRYRLTEGKHGWNYAYEYSDARGIWSEGSMPVIPGATVTRTKGNAIDKAMDTANRDFTAKPAPAAAPAPEKSEATSAIERAKRRLREVRNEIANFPKDAKSGISQAKLDELRAKETAIEREIRALRQEAMQDDAPAPAPAKAEKEPAPAPAPAPEPKEALKEDTAKAKAQADLMAGLSDLADIFGKNTKLNITPEQEQKLVPVLARVMDAAFRLGYYAFKDAARFVYGTIRDKIGADVAEQITLDHLQGAYISMAGKYKDQGADTKRAVIDVETLDEITNTENSNGTQTDGAPAPGASGNPPLEGVPPDDVQGAESGKPAGNGGNGRRKQNAGRAGNTGKAGDAAGSGVGNGQGDLPISAGGNDGGSPADGGVPASEKRPAPDQQAAAKSVEAGDYRITDLTRLGEGGAKTKYANNVAAIRLMRELQETGRQATPAEQDVLARYVGWGGIPQAFDADNKDWSKQHAELKELMATDEWDAAVESTQYAHYTSQGIIEGIYGALAHLGFGGGRILEPGSGVGNFVGLMPDSLRSSTRFTGVERERIAGGIAKLLYPRQNIQQQDFTAFKGEDGYFDAVIGNPPFASTPLTDVSGRKHLSGLSVHNYFFAKAVDMLRENGVLAQVVTSSFLDAKGDRARTYISHRAKLLGAIRLPNSAFMGNAGTDVTTDIIFLQKLPEAEWGSKAAKDDAKRWLDLSTVPDPRGGEDIPINRYFADNPQMMLGRMERTGGRYHAEMPGLVAPKGADIKAELEQRIAQLPANVYQAAAAAKTEAMQAAALERISGMDVQVGGYFVADGALYQRAQDIAGETFAVKITPDTQWTEKTKLGAKKYDALTQAAGVRRVLRALIGSEIAERGDVAELRAELNDRYDAMVKAHGYFNDRSMLQLLGDDPDLPLLLSLENGYDPGISAGAAKKEGIKAVASSAKKAPIFTRGVVDGREPITKADSPADALMVSIAERGQIDPAFIGQLLSRDGADVLDELTRGDKPALFVDPYTQGYVLRDDYLSGNVRKKLKQAEAAGMDNNVRALQAVLPEDVPSHEIQGKLGAPWIPTDTVEDFAKFLLGAETRATVTHIPALNTYGVHLANYSDVANTNTYGTKDYTAEEILYALLNNKEIRVGWRDQDGKFHLDKTKTDEAIDKATTMRQAFGDWLMADPARAERMTREYNDKMNNYVVRKFDGSILTFPGKVSDKIIKFRRHQRNAIARIIQDGRGLLDHVVGAGKTFTVIGAAQELKRTGLAKKSMIVVPNHLVKQWATDYYKLYPGANILTATKKDFTKANRRKFLAKVATGDWDAVIIAHSSYGFIKPDAEFEMEFNRQRIAEILQAIEEMGPAKGQDQQSKRTVKQLAKMKENLEQRIKSLRDKPMDDLLDFGQLGVDQLFVDEAHLFKNLMFTTKMQNVRGLGQPEGSMRAYDMFIKTRQIAAANGGTRGVVFATGTPVSNSLAEMYHMLRYLAPETLADMGHKTFDAWANTFADVEQVWMQAMSGEGYKSTNRMSKFVNTPDLLKVYDQVADTVTMDDIKQAYSEENNGAEFPIPALKGGRRAPVSLIRSKEQNDYMEEIAKRAKALEQRKGKPEKGEDNMLSILGDARKAAMDIRLVMPDITERDPNGRIAVVANNVYETYQKFNDVRGTQLIFSDMGTPKKHAAKELEEYNALAARIAVLEDADLQANADLGDEAAIDKINDAEEAQAELAAKGKDWLDAIKAAQRGFSIYDDTKAALMERGIPENEIAFIHDYNTDDQKAALFRAVNDGKIRVVLGSTPKMGAGTNVQERLVELHHMDVPWKPSDIEQREGRIVRQGNKLLEEIGADFEVSVKAYATQDTLDLFMWQVQEKKLGMINQLRTGNVGREMDDAFEELQMSAGEMQAAATSNPYLLEEIQLKDKVKKLERQKKSFEGQRNDLINRKTRAERDAAKLPAEIAELERLRDATEAYEDAARNRLFSMTINGEAFTDAEAAGAKLRELTGEDDAEGDAEPAQAELGDEGKAKPRKKMTPIELNGQEYKSKAAVADAYRRAAGDRAPFLFTRGGEQFIQRATAKDAIKADVMKAAETDDTVAVGALGKYEFSVTGTHAKGKIILTVEATVDGKEIPFDAEAGSYKDVAEAAEKGPQDVVQAMDRTAGRAPGLMHWRRGDLAAAQKVLKDLQGKDFDAQWEGGKELEAARKRHAEVLRKINGTNLPQLEAGVTYTIEQNTDTGIYYVLNIGGKTFQGAEDGFATRPEAQAWAESMQGAAPFSDISPVDPVRRADGTFARQDPVDAMMGAAGAAPGQVSKLDIELLKQVAGGADLGAVLDAIAAKSSDPAARQLAARLKALGLKTSIALGSNKNRTMAAGGNSENYVAGYSPRRDAIELFLPQDAERNILHEATHAATARAIRNGGLAAQQMRSLYAHVEGTGLLRGLYAMSNLDEFVAEGFSNPQIQGLLKSLPAMPNGEKSRFANAWEKFVSIVRSVLGLSNTTALDQFMAAGDRLMVENATSAPLTSSAAVMGNVRADKYNTFLRRAGVSTRVANAITDNLQSEKQFNFWHRTVGTQYHKAQVHSGFKKVYDAAQDYLAGVSSFANEAADLAPSLLPKLDSWKDLTRKPPATADLAATGKAVFQGTLTDKKVYSDAELRAQFRLTPAQIRMYREFRATVDKSLDDLGKSEILRYAGAAAAPVRDQVLGAADVMTGAGILANHLNGINQQADAREVLDKAQHLEDLKDEGYAPLMRFGEHTVHVVNAAGVSEFFGMYETPAEAERMARDMRALFPQATVTKGIQSKEESKLYAGINPATIEAFANATGQAVNPLFQEYLKKVKNNHSAMKRLIKRKGTAGYSEDTSRVLAAFVTSTARLASRNLHDASLSNAAAAIPNNQGDVKDEAAKLVEYINNPREEAAGVRNLLFVNFIGGSVASAALNMTQPVMMTLPYLSQFGGVAQSTARLTKAMGMAARGGSASITDPVLRAAMHRAEQAGDVSPQEIHNLQAEAMRSSKGINVGGKEVVSHLALRKAAFVWGGFFSLAEQFNRRATFIAAYETARGMSPARLAQAGVANAYDFAVKAIHETQGVYNRGNRPAWARGALGATLMTFKQYSISYLEFIKRLPPRERLFALGLLVLMAGANGLPFVDDGDDIIDTIMQAMGYNFSAKKFKHNAIAAVIGQTGADLLLHGATGAGGLPLDVSMRMGMANLLPGTGILLKSETDKSRQVGEFAGPAGALANKAVEGAGKLLQGDVGGALMSVAGTAVNNAAKGVDMANTGMYRDMKGRKVIDTDLGDAVTKSLGFQPSNVALEQRKLGEARNTIAVSKAELTSIHDEWARMEFEKEAGAADKARERMQAWNEKNPESPIKIDRKAVTRRLKEMHKAKSDRLLATAPKSMRAGLREEITGG